MLYIFCECHCLVNKVPTSPLPISPDEVVLVISRGYYPRFRRLQRFLPLLAIALRLSPFTPIGFFLPFRANPWHYSSLGKIGCPLPRSAYAAFVLSIEEALAIWWSLLSECLCDMVVALCPSIKKRSTVSLDALPSLPKAAAKLV